MNIQLQIPSPLVELHDASLRRSGVRLYLKRDDLINPEIPGNKWRKLKYNISTARVQGYSTLLTFGGAHSNHIRATAAVGYYFDFNTIGVIRGEEHLPLNDVLFYATERGMLLSYMDRATYRWKMEPSVLDSLRARFGDFYLLPEGGSNSAALRGCAELVAEIDIEFDAICCPCGTGGTLAGIAAGLRNGQRALGFSVLKGGQFLHNDVADLQRATFGRTIGEWAIEYDFHFGGFAKRRPELDEFIVQFASNHGMTLDRIYVAKMMYGIYELVRRGSFQAGAVIVALVTG